MKIKEFGLFLFQLRSNKDLSLAEVSWKAKIDRTLLDRIERGKVATFPRHKTLSNLAEFYNFEFQYVPEQLLVMIDSAPSIDGEFINLEDEEKLITMEEGEKILIQRALEQSNCNRIKTARILKIGTRTLYRKLKDYGIDYRRYK